jgi:signal transduction histidine kinase
VLKLFSPAVALMNRLKYRQKFLLVGLVLVLPLILLMAVFLVQTNNLIDFTAQERTGAALMPSLTAFLRDVQDYRAYSLAAPEGFQPAREKTANLEQVIVADIQAVDAAMSQYASHWRLVQNWQAVKADWNALHARLPNLTFQDNLDSQTEFARSVLSLLEDVGNESNITLDPELIPYYFGDLVLHRLPVAAEYLSQVKALGLVATARLSLPTTDAARLPVLSGLSKNAVDEVQQDVGYILVADPSARQTLQKGYDAYANASKYFLEIPVGRVIAALEAQNPRVMKTPQDFDDASSSAFISGYTFSATALQGLDGLLKGRLDGLVQGRTVAISAVLIALWLSIYLFNAFYLAVQKTIRNLSVASQQMVSGQLNETLKLESRDELAQVVESFNNVARALVSTNQALQIASVKAEESSRLKSEFLSTMSHELRTPLNAILGFTGVLLAGMDGVMDESAHYMVERVELNSKRLLDLINNILDISKIEAGRMDVIESRVVLRQLVDQWRLQLGVLAKQKGLAFDCEVDPALPESVYLDRERVTQIATNLLSNAAKFTENGSIRLALTAQEEWLQLQITDTGIGIPPHALDFIFDEFRQVDGSSRRAYGGTGLGLAIVHKLCRLMNGSVVVNSSLGFGTTFTVKLPLKPVVEESTANVDLVPVNA